MNITPFDTFTPPGSGTVTRDYPQAVFGAPYFTQNRLADMLGSIVTDAVNAMLPSLLSDSPYIQAAVDAAITALAVLRSGDTMSGPLFFTDALPTQDHQAATKLYVDLMLAGAGGGGLEEVPAYPTNEIWARSLGAWVPISDLLAGGTTPGGDGTVTSITAGLGLTGGTITTTGTIALANTTVSPGSYTNANITVDQQGRLISASNGAAPGPGDGSAGGTVTQINTGIGLTGGPITATGTISLANTAVTPGTYQGLTIDAQGRVTAATNAGYVTSSGVTSITAGTGLTGGTITSTGSLGLSNTGVAAGSYSLASLTVDAQGRVTAITSGTAGGTGTVQSIATGTGLTGGPISVAGTIALANTAVAPGSYTLANITVDQQGRLTAASTGTPAFLPLSGGTLTGPLTLAGDATLALQAVTLQQLQTSITGTPIHSGDTPPSLPQPGDLWMDTSQTPPELMVWNGSAWVASTQPVTGFLPLTGGALAGPGNLYVGGDFMTGGSFQALSAATFRAAVNVTGLLTAFGNLNVSGAVYVNGATTLNSSLNVATTLAVGTNINVGGGLDVTNPSTLRSSLILLGPLMNSFSQPIYQNCALLNTAGGVGGAVNYGLQWSTSDNTLNFIVLADGTSDAQVKHDIADSEVDALAVLSGIPLRSFTYNRSDWHLPIGVVAQEIEALIPEMVALIDGVRVVNYRMAVPYLIRAVQQLAARLERFEGSV